jgi:hypothetical protein
MLSYIYPVDPDWNTKNLISGHLRKLRNQIVSLALLVFTVSSCNSSGQRAGQSSTNIGNATSKPDTVIKIARANSSDSLVVPGRSVGKIQLGTDAEGVYQQLGKPDAGDAAMGKSVATWFKDKDSVYSFSIYTLRNFALDNPPALIKQIRVTVPSYRTADDIGPGSLFEQVQERYKLEPAIGYRNGEDSISVYFNRSGIAFEFNNTKTCIGVLVYQSGILPPDAYSKYMP